MSVKSFITSATGEQCYFQQSLPQRFAYSSGTVLNGIPIICGGKGADDVPRKTCYKLDVVAML
jgi:hypothetical protein